MDKPTLIKTIAYRMGNVRGQDSAIEIELDLAIARLEALDFLPWFLLSENNFYELEAGENRVPVPPGFLKEYEEGALYRDAGSGGFIPLSKNSQDLLKQNLTGEGTPEKYALTNTYFRVFPIPRENVRLELLFYRTSGTLNVENNPWYDYAPELVIAETIWAMLSARRDKMADYWRGMAQQHTAKLRQRDDERRLANYEVTFGGDD